MTLSPDTAAVKAMLDRKPGAVAVPYTPSRSASPISLMYKVMAKVFAILTLRGTAFVVLKCDPHLAEILREQYAGIGHRTHVDRRYWISIDLGTDVPLEEIERLIGHSYDLVSAGLTRRQKAELAALSLP